MALSTATATFEEKDQNWQEESTTYWFAIEGQDYGTGFQFDGSLYGIVESGSDTTIVDQDGAPLTETDHETIAVRNTASVTDEMRAE